MIMEKSMSTVRGSPWDIPLPARGTRVLVTLLHEMRRADIEYGLASICGGGGLGIATILKRRPLKPFFHCPPVERLGFHTSSSFSTGGVDAHIELDAHALGAGPHNFPYDFNGLFISMEGNGHADGFTHGDCFVRLDKDPPGVDIRNKIDEAEVHGGIADLQQTPLTDMTSTFFGGCFYGFVYHVRFFFGLVVNLQ